MFIDPESFYSPKEVVKKNGGILPMSESGVYAAISRNEIPVKRIGSRILISGKYLCSLLAD